MTRKINNNTMYEIYLIIENFMVRGSCMTSEGGCRPPYPTEVLRDSPLVALRYKNYVLYFDVFL